LIKIEISLQGLLLIALGLLGIWALRELWPVILLVLISVILMIGLLPYVDAMVRRGIPRGFAVLILLLVFLLGIVGMFSLMVPALVTEFDDVRDNLPEYAAELEELLAKVSINVELQERARDINWDQIISGRAAFDYGQRILTTTLSIITIVVITAYLLADTPRLERFLSQFIPPHRKSDVDEIFQAMTRVVGGFLRGQAITSLAIAIFTFVLLRIVGAPNPLAFAVLAAFADVIPLIGALIATVPPVAATLQESSTKALIVLVGLIAYQQFEDRYLAPRVYGRTLNLPPVIVLIAILAGAELLGITGVLLALPLTAAGRVAIDFFLRHRGWLLPQQTDQPFAPDEPATQSEDERESGEAVEVEASGEEPVPDGGVDGSGVQGEPSREA
jgi:predicted PurR-regulated permease PerM